MSNFGQFVQQFSRRDFVKLLISLLFFNYSGQKTVLLPGLPPPKYSFGERVFITWFDGESEVIEFGTVVGLAYGRSFYFVSHYQSWWYFVQLDSSVKGSIDDDLSVCQYAEVEVFPQ